MLSMFTDTTSLLIKWMNRLFLTMNVGHEYATKLSSLREIGKLAASELDWEEMLKTITGKTKEVLDVDACSVYTLDRQELVLISTDGLPVSVVGHRIKVGEGITGHVAKTREALAVEDATRDPRSTSFSSAPRTGRKRRVYQSILSVPLIAQDRLIGIIDARTFNPKKWAQTDIDFLSIIAEQVAGIIEKDKFRMEIGRELEAARYIQAKLLPDPLPKVHGYDMAALIIPNSDVGGDYYDLLTMDKGRLAVIVADVSGKGIGAAILMANLQGLINAYTYARSEIDTKDAVANLNAALCDSTEPEKFVTMFCGILDTKTGLLTYTNAGHNHPFIYRIGEDKKPQALDVGGMVLGMMKDVEYSKGSAQLTKGDFLVLYSDGVTEARNEDGELFGEERLHETVYKYMEDNPDSPSAQQLLDTIHSAVRDFSSGLSFADDLTLVVLRCI